MTGLMLRDSGLVGQRKKFALSRSKSVTCCCVIFDEKDRTADMISHLLVAAELRTTYSDLLLFARFASLHDSHQMSMLTLFLRLRAPTSRVRNINAVLGHNRESRQSSFGSLWGILLG
jgi:hypothetical protein